MRILIDDLLQTKFITYQATQTSSAITNSRNGEIIAGDDLYIAKFMRFAFNYTLNKSIQHTHTAESPYSLPLYFSNGFAVSPTPLQHYPHGRAVQEEKVFENRKTRTAKI